MKSESLLSSCCNCICPQPNVCPFQTSTLPPPPFTPPPGPFAGGPARTVLAALPLKALLRVARPYRCGRPPLSPSDPCAGGPALTVQVASPYWTLSKVDEPIDLLDSDPTEIAEIINKTEANFKL